MGIPGFRLRRGRVVRKKGRRQARPTGRSPWRRSSNRCEERTSQPLPMPVVCIDPPLPLSGLRGGGAWSVLSCNVKKWSCWPCAPRCGGWRSKYCARFVVWHAHSALPAWISIGVCHEFAQAYIRATMMCLETSAQNGHLLPKHLPKMGSCYKEIKEASRLPLGSS